MVQKGKDDDSSDTNDNKQSREDESHPKKESLESAQMPFGNCHITPFYTDHRIEAAQNRNNEPSHS